MPQIPGVLGPFVVVPAGSGVDGSEWRVRARDGADYAEHPANGPPREAQFTRALLLGRSPVTVAAVRETCPELFRTGAPMFVLPESGNVGDSWPARPFSEVNGQDDHPVVGVIRNCHDARLNAAGKPSAGHRWYSRAERR